MGNTVGSKDDYKLKGGGVGITNMPGYSAAHKWIAKNKLRTYKCERCDREVKRTEFANLSGEYRRDLSDWQELCMPCHSKLDGKGEVARQGVKRLHAAKRARTACAKGHLWTKENTRILASGSRMCRQCARLRKKKWRDKNPGYHSEWRRRHG